MNNCFKHQQSSLADSLGVPPLPLLRACLNAAQRDAVAGNIVNLVGFQEPNNA